MDWTNMMDLTQLNDQIVLITGATGLIGKTIVKIDKFYPSSQLCNCCGYKYQLAKDLNVRSWVCPNCNDKHDRDVNAAKNILDEGLRLLVP